MENWDIFSMAFASTTAKVLPVFRRDAAAPSYDSFRQGGRHSGARNVKDDLIEPCALLSTQV